jgi:hypothetical protein
VAMQRPDFDLVDHVEHLLNAVSCVRGGS